MGQKNYRLNLFKKAASNTDIIDIDQTVINYHYNTSNVCPLRNVSLIYDDIEFSTCILTPVLLPIHVCGKLYKEIYGTSIRASTQSSQCKKYDVKSSEVI